MVNIISMSLTMKFSVYLDFTFLRVSFTMVLFGEFYVYIMLSRTLRTLTPQALCAAFKQ